MDKVVKMGEMLDGIAQIVVDERVAESRQRNSFVLFCHVVSALLVNEPNLEYSPLRLKCRARAIVEVIFKAEPEAS